MITKCIVFTLELEIYSRIETFIKICVLGDLYGNEI